MSESIASHVLLTCSSRHVHGAEMFVRACRYSVDMFVRAMRRYSVDIHRSNNASHQVRYRAVLYLKASILTKPCWLIRFYKTLGLHS